jgi:protein SCO1
MRNLLLTLLLILPCAAGAQTLPSDSVLQITDTFTDQNGNAFQLRSRQGKPQLVSMFYTSCPYICPLIIDSAKGIEHALTQSERAQLRILLISMDAENDLPPTLLSVSRKRRLDANYWTLAHADENGVRHAAAVLGIRFRKLSSGDFNHTSALILLDADGRIVARTEKLGTVPDAEFLATVKRTLAKP